MRTSLSDPLRIAAVTTGPRLGRIGLTLCPGKYDPCYWNRDLGLDLDAVRDWGATAVVTLLESSELIRLRVPRLEKEILIRKMLWFHLPIRADSIPDERFEKKWEIIGEQLRSMARTRRDVLIHCRGGLGRTGMVAARLLIELGMGPIEAIEGVRKARPGAIETPQQENYVLRYVCPNLRR
jgi:ADP-ribosyl-[dinitrogen reductase] hydrolase